MNEGDCLTTELFQELNRYNVPNHVAIIMDGNRRWAKDKKMPSSAGHLEGADRLSLIIKAAAKVGVKVLTVFAFSTENWARSPKEINALMDLFEEYLLLQKEELIKEGVRLEAIGNLSLCPLKVQKAFQEVKEATAMGEKITLILAINYGSRDEIKRSIEKILEDIEKNTIAKKDLSEELISQYLDTAKWKDPDLMIRTSGEQRLSNFMLWQLSYTEIYTTDVLWPDFSDEHFYQAIVEYQKRKRRKGGE